MGKKILYVFGGLYAPNGMSSIISQKINYLAEHTDNQMFLVLTERPNVPHYYKLSDKVNWVNFDINFDEIDTMQFIKKFFFFKLKQRKFKKNLIRYMMELRPDVTVSVARREINFITKVKDGSKKIAEIHFSRTYYRKVNIRYLPEFVNQLLSKIWMNFLIHDLKRLDRFIVLTQEDIRNWPELSNVMVIPNPIYTYPNHGSSCTSKQVIAVGRYTYQKGFDLLISAWILVKKRHPDWKLRIFGAGNPDAYRRLVCEKELDDVVFCEGATNDVYARYDESSVFVLSSRYEGLPLVLIEAMSAGLPCVSFTCPCGPRDCIKDGVDGILVEAGNIEKLADGICLLIENETLRKQMGAAARRNAVRFEESNIMHCWIELFESL